MTDLLIPFSEGDRYDNIDVAQLPFAHVRPLGQGAFSTVEEVRDFSTGRVFARKLFFLRRDNRKRLLETFANEWNIIQSVQGHHHMIKLHAAYTTNTQLGLILTPVADCDLESYMDALDVSRANNDTKKVQTMTVTLEMAFGCLAFGLAYLKDNKIRHKDIKTRNILIHNGRVLYTDFGIAFDYQGLETSMTEGPTAMTKTYAAPEVIAGQQKKSSSDVFSLGCVFFEILQALYALRTVHEPRPYSTILSQLHAQLESLYFRPFYSFLSGMIVSMTQFHPRERCSAHVIGSQLATRPGFSCSHCVSDHRTSTGRILVDMILDQPLEKVQYGINYITRQTSLRLPLTTGRIIRKTSRTLTRHMGSIDHEFFISLNILTGRDSQISAREEIEKLHGVRRGHHFLRVFASVTSNDHLRILFQPAPDQTLDEFLDNYNLTVRHSAPDDSSDELLASKQVWQFFGCLADSLAWCHSQSVSLRNLTSQDIMVHERSIMILLCIDGPGTSEDETILKHSISKKAQRTINLTEGISEWQMDIVMLNFVYIEILDVILAPAQFRGTGQMRLQHSLPHAMESIRQRVRRGKREWQLYRIWSLMDNIYSTPQASFTDARSIASTITGICGLGCDECRGNWAVG